MSQISNCKTGSTNNADSIGKAMPRHIAIIMDGNGRWATARFLPRVAGHARGVKAVRKIVGECVSRGIDYLTLFAFSSENWRRPADEVSVLMQLFRIALKGEVKKMQANNIRLKVVGDLSKFDLDLQAMVLAAEAKTAANTGLTLTVCVNYGGQWDIVQACNKALIENHHAGPITEQLLAENLAMAYAPEPDLLVRTGGEARISNFLLWQMAYSEFYFTETLWPDFGKGTLDLAIASFQNRERRFGGTSEQLIKT